MAPAAQAAQAQSQAGLRPGLASGQARRRADRQKGRHHSAAPFPQDSHSAAPFPKNSVARNNSQGAIPQWWTPTRR